MTFPVYHFVDVETSGLPEDEQHGPQEVIACYIATFNAATGEVRELFDEHFLPVGRIAPDVAAINGYSEESYRRAPRFSYAHAERIAECLRDVYKLVGSNPAFDVCMLQRMFARTRTPWPFGPGRGRLRTLDLGSWAEGLVIRGKIKSTSLNEVGQFFGLSPQSHTAKGDVLAGIQIFQLLGALQMQGFNSLP